MTEGSQERETTPITGLDDEEVGLVTLANMLLRGRRLIVGTTLTVFVVVLTILIVRGPSREFQAVSRFGPQGGGGSSRTALIGLAQQFGVDVDASNGSESVGFYMALLDSRELLLQAALTEYRFPLDLESTDSLEGAMVDLFEIESESTHEEQLAVVSLMRSLIDVSTEGGAGLVILETTAPWPGLAEAINVRLLELLNDFNLRRRQTRAAEERRFVENRLGHARAELDSAESDMRVFLDRNRRIEESPQLQFEQGRLQRQVGLRQEVYTSLAQAIEQARIDEVRNTPVFTVIDGPVGSAQLGGIRRRVLAQLGLVAGVVLGIALALVQGYTGMRRQAGSEEYSEFLSLWRETWTAPLQAPRSIGRMLSVTRKTGTRDVEHTGTRDK